MPRTLTTEISPTSSSIPAAKPARLKSVDVLRGFDMFWIIGGAEIAHALGAMQQNAVTRFLGQQLSHEDWQGLHAYDCIYPLFLFLVGVSIVFSIDRARREQPRRAIVGRILRRGLLLYVFGFIYHGGLTAKWPDVRFSGVLQLIAFCYVGAALVYLFVGSHLRVIAGIAVALLVGYWAVLTFVPFPDVVLETPVLAQLETQAHSKDPAAVLQLVPQRTAGTYEAGHNLSNYLDYRFLPGKKFNGAYESQGLLSPIPATVICLLGIFAGRWLRDCDDEVRRKAAWLALAGAVAIAVGLLWSVHFPVVKKLWTSSFCLITGGISAVLLSVFYLVIDGWKADRWCAPFLWLGSNSIAIYLGYELIRPDRISPRLVGGSVKAALDAHVARGAGEMLQAIVALGLALAIVRFLYQRKIFLRV